MELPCFNLNNFELDPDLECWKLQSLQRPSSCDALRRLPRKLVWFFLPSISKVQELQVLRFKP